MAIELCALALAIRDQGGDQVLAKLRKIDGEAKKTGSKPVNVPVNAPGADATAAKLKLVTANATAAAKSLSALKSIAGGIGIGAGIIGTQALGSALMDTARAYDDAEKAARKLNSASRLTGAALGDVQRIAKEAQVSFRLSSAASADLTASVVRLTSRAGELNRSGEFMAKWLDLTAANGYGAAEAMQALETTLAGQDEGLNKLGLANPSQIWAKMAAEIGTTVNKLSEQDKWQAIVNEVIRQGGRVQGEYAKQLDTAAGKTELLRQATEALKVELGRAFVSTREGIADAGTPLLGWLTSAVRKFNEAVAAVDKLEAALLRFDRNIMRRLRGLPLEVAPTTPTAADRARQQGPPNPNTRAPIVVTAPGVDPKKAAEEAAKAERERRAQIAEQVGAVETMMRLRVADIGTLQAAVRLEGLLTAELAKGTASLERRAEIQQQLQTLRGSGALIKPLDVRDMPRTLDPKAATKIEVPVELRPKATIPPDAFEDLRKDVEFQFAGLGMSIAGVLGSAIATGFAGGDVGQVVLQGLGSIFMQMGQSLLTYGAAMVGLLPTLANPFTSGPAALAAGAILLALGGALGGIAAGRGSRGGGGGFASGAPSSSLSGRQTIADANIRRATLPANAQPGTGRAAVLPPAQHITVLGVNTPQGQRLIGEASANFRRRGG